MGPTETAPAVAAPPRPRVGRAMQRGFRAAYDYLGTVLIASSFWLAGALLIGTGASGLLFQVSGAGVRGVLIGTLGGTAAAVVGTGPLTAALFAHVRRLMLHDDPRWWELPLAVGRRWRQGLALAGLQVGVGLVLFVDLIFLMGRGSRLLWLLGMLFLYPLLFWWGAALLQWPLAAEREDDSLSQIVKKSFLLLLDNLLYMTVIGAVVLLLTWLSVQTRFGRVFLTLGWAGTLAFLQTAALRELLPKYGLLAVPTDEEEPGSS